MNLVFGEKAPNADWDRAHFYTQTLENNVNPTSPLGARSAPSFIMGRRSGPRRAESYGGEDTAYEVRASEETGSRAGLIAPVQMILSNCAGDCVGARLYFPKTMFAGRLQWLLGGDIFIKTSVGRRGAQRWLVARVFFYARS